MSPSDANITVPNPQDLIDTPEAAGNIQEVYARVAALAGEVDSHARYYQEVLAYIGAAFVAPYGLLEVSRPSEVISKQWHSGTTSEEFWREPVSQFVAEARAQKRATSRMYSAPDSAVQVGFLVAPIPIREEGATGAIALVIEGSNQTQLDQELSVLVSIAHLLSVCADYVGTSQASSGGDVSAGRVLDRVSSYTSATEMAFTIVNNLRNKLECQQAALGVVRSAKVRLLAVSGMDQVTHRSPGVRSIRGAMEECLDFGRTLICQGEEEWCEDHHRLDVRLHRQWREASGGSAVATLPLAINGQVRAIVALRRGPGETFTSKELEELEELVRPYAAALDMVDKANRGMIRLLIDRARKARNGLISTARLKTKIAASAGLCLAAWFLFGTLAWRISVPCEVVPAVSRCTSAAFVGRLASAPVVAGDRVVQDQVLCTFDTRELELEREKLKAEAAIAGVNESKAMAEGLLVDAQLYQAQQKRAEARAQVLAEKIAKAVVRAPFDGVVVSGDLRTRVGEVLPEGEPLFEISADRGGRLRLYVPQDEAAFLRPGQEGSFAGRARPEDRRGFVIERVAPSTRPHNDAMVYVVAARLDEPGRSRLFGLEGVARVDVGRKPVWWVALHRLEHFLRMRFWL